MARTSGPDADARAILESFRHVLRILRESSARAEQQAGLSGAQLFALQLVARHGPLAVGELAARTLTHQSSVSVVVKKLVEQGLCERRVSERDARRAEIAITAAGRARLERAPEIVQDRFVRAIRAMKPGDRESLAALLRGLVERLDAHAGAAPMFFESAPARRRPPAKKKR